MFLLILRYMPLRLSSQMGSASHLRPLPTHKYSLGRIIITYRSLRSSAETTLTCAILSLQNWSRVLELLSFSGYSLYL